MTNLIPKIPCIIQSKDRKFSKQDKNVFTGIFRDSDILGLEILAHADV